MGNLETILTPENRLLGVCDAYEGRSQSGSSDGTVSNGGLDG